MWNDGYWERVQNLLERQDINIWITWRQAEYPK